MNLEKLFLYKERLIRYFTDDSRVKYLMLAQAFKVVVMIVAMFPAQFGCWFNGTLAWQIMIIGMLIFLVVTFVLTWGWLDRFFSWWFKIPMLNQRWRECTSCSAIVALDFYAACRCHWLFMLPGIGLFFVTFHIDYKTLKALEK